MTEQTVELSPMERWKQDKLLKKSKKKARDALQDKGYTKSEATKLVKQAVQRIGNKPAKKSAGRGR